MLDSTGKTIAVGDKVRWRSQVYTIKQFLPGQGRTGIAGIEFEEPQLAPHQNELPDEWSVDRMES